VICGGALPKFMASIALRKPMLSGSVYLRHRQIPKLVTTEEDF